MPAMLAIYHNST